MSCYDPQTNSSVASDGTSNVPNSDSCNKMDDRLSEDPSIKSDINSTTLIDAQDEPLVSSVSEHPTTKCSVSMAIELDQQDVDSIPVPPPQPKAGVPILAHKLWIGNLDKRLTEQNILKFVTQYGRVVSFRYLFKAGSERAEPRGYVFVEYATREEAEKAKAGLDGKRALGKKIIADWAKADQGLIKKTATIVSETWDPNSVSSTLDSRASTTDKIAALEAKLRQMEDCKADSSTKRPKLSINKLPTRQRIVRKAASVSGVHKRNRLRPVY